MKDIKIDNYTIAGVPNSNSYVLRVTKKVKEGKRAGEPYNDNLAYTATIKQALESYVAHRLTHTSKDASVILSELQETLSRIYKKYGLTV